VSRIRKFYENRFRIFADKFQKPPDEFSEELFSRAVESGQQQHIKRDLALAFVLASLRRIETKDFPKHFLCDAGLGGLVRWLRAAGYEAVWKPKLDDAAVIREAERLGATLITTDTMMMERGVLRHNLLPAVCIPSSLTCAEQLAVVFRELGLTLRDARCMACGGELRYVPKQFLAERIPPRTALWLDEFFVCAQCSQLFWRGTHWEKIARELKKLTFAPR
jgi:uncharacterized protein with PIN domain